jgi:hypothetical protein
MSLPARSGYLTHERPLVLLLASYWRSSDRAPGVTHTHSIGGHIPMENHSPAVAAALGEFFLADRSQRSNAAILHRPMRRTKPVLGSSKDGGNNS